MSTKKDAIIEEVIIDENEKDLAEAEAKNEPSNGSFTLVLKAPFSYEGKEFSELHFDYDKLTGKDSLAIERELQTLNRPVVVREISGEYQIRLACRASRESVSVDFLKALPLKDCNKILNSARSFLLASE